MKNPFRLYKDLGDVGKQAIVLDLMGDITRYNKKIKLALDYYREAYQLYSDIKSDSKDELTKKIKELEFWIVHGSVEQDSTTEILPL